VTPQTQSTSHSNASLKITPLKIISDRLKPEICFLLGWLRWTLLPKEYHSNSLSGHGWTPNLPVERWTLPLSYCHPHGMVSRLYLLFSFDVDFYFICSYSMTEEPSAHVQLYW